MVLIRVSSSFLLGGAVGSRHVAGDGGRRYGDVGDRVDEGGSQDGVSYPVCVCVIV